MRSMLAVAALTLALAAPSSAEIFRCVGPNGDVRFTSNAAQCPNAAPHAPKEGALQTVRKAEAPLASARPGSSKGARRSTPAAQDGSAANEAIWREKKAEAEHSVKTLEFEHERILAAVRWCNKGHAVSTQNPRTGLRQQVPCEEIHAERTKVEGELERARAYLETGLEEECRQADCMPGWIR